MYVKHRLYFKIYLTVGGNTFHLHRSLKWKGKHNKKEVFSEKLEIKAHSFLSEMVSMKAYIEARSGFDDIVKTDLISKISPKYRQYWANGIWRLDIVLLLQPGWFRAGKLKFRDVERMVNIHVIMRQLFGS